MARRMDMYSTPHHAIRKVREKQWTSPASIDFFCFQINHNREPSISLYGQLYMREFFYTCATNNPKFDRMAGNSICLQIPWSKNPEALAKWAEVSFINIYIGPCTMRSIILVFTEYFCLDGGDGVEGT